MPRNMVGLLAAVGSAMSSLIAFAHGDLAWVAIADAAAATGLAAYIAASSKKIKRCNTCRTFSALFVVWVFGAAAAGSWIGWKVKSRPLTLAAFMTYLDKTHTSVNMAAPWQLRRAAAGVQV